MNTQIRKPKGFTIIEVVLVLAIAALIFLMVFIALPALQASQRDTARKNDAGTVAAAVQNYASSERKPVTPADAADLRTYVNDLDQYDPADINVVATMSPVGDIPVAADGSDDNTIRVYVGNKCNGTKLAAGNSRTAAVVVVLEGGSGDTPHCVDV